MIYSTDGTVLTSSEKLIGRSLSYLYDGSWIVSRQTFDTIDIEMVIAVPKSHIWHGILWRILWPLIVFLLGIFVVGFLIRRMLRDQHENAQLETEKHVMSHELVIAHDI